MNEHDMMEMVSRLARIETMVKELLVRTPDLEPWQRLEPRLGPPDHHLEEPYP